MKITIKLIEQDSIWQVTSPDIRVLYQFYQEYRLNESEQDRQIELTIPGGKTIKDTEAREWLELSLVNEFWGRMKHVATSI